MHKNIELEAQNYNRDILMLKVLLNLNVLKY